MNKLSIVCASSLAGGREAFSTIGQVTILPESGIDANAIRGAAVLATRSKVKVNDALLTGCSLSFYGTATAGTDHVDVDALDRRGIAWVSAPGSNANSVAEYIIAALARIGLNQQTEWRGKTIAIIGAGHVGSRLALLAQALGMHVILNDPPLAEKSGSPVYRPLAEALAAADVVTLHVPLTDGGAHATRGMANAHFFAQMKKGAVFMNASRGEVVCEKELLPAADAGRFSALVLDVFEQEPHINPVVLAAATIATPHIAGYSLDARLNGTAMVYRAVCEHFGIEPAWEIPEEKNPRIMNGPSGHAGSFGAYKAITAAYDPVADDARLRHPAAGISLGRHFQDLRLHYAERHEFRHFEAQHEPGAHPDELHMLKNLGFGVKPRARAG